MATFQTKQSNNSFLYLKVIIKANYLLCSRTYIYLVPEGSIIVKSSPETDNGSIPPDQHSWCKLGETKNFIDKKIVIDTILAKDDSVEIEYHLVEDDDNISRLFLKEEYRLSKDGDVANKVARIEINILS